MALGLPAGARELVSDRLVRSLAEWVPARRSLPGARPVQACKQWNSGDKMGVLRVIGMCVGIKDRT